ncbi:glutamine synthetase family protein [Streptomyces sp. NBC_01294]|uniref:glutamine synthetase family protein n=1 Tax=Streptomyces sp. NBC_01294 TaxID=2903815 RepID=UPI002DD9B32A|nr:glutamine synthetase family protein [Streptomyces sp. NBC_01294]WRZ58725.1 glutamine synthetase family protein [Streptomyces sp. NBC_01294]
MTKARTTPRVPERPYGRFDTGSVGFVQRHGLWDEARQAAAEELEETLETLEFVRVGYGDPHGLMRSKTLTVESFRTVLRNGIDMSPGPFVFDTGHAVGVDFFADGGGIGLTELTGAGDFLIVPDPLTFRVLPHTEAATGWVIADEYLRDGSPHPLSSRAVLRRACERAAERGLEYVVGLEVEWYLTRLTGSVTGASVGGFGIQGEPPAVEPANSGYQFNLDTFTDGLMPVITPLARALRELGLPLRTVEHESGPGQLEFTFSPMNGLDAADAMLLFRTVAKQICGRLGYHASFMALPGLDRFDPSGWHLHQSLFDTAAGTNAFVPRDGRGPLSPLGLSYVAGLLAHAAETTLLAVPTVNGYRRLQGQFALSPDRIVWSAENRGALVRLLGGPGEESTHLENRIGEPCANPYLYLAAQLAAGLDGIERGLQPGGLAQDPHADSAAALPRDLAEAVAAAQDSALTRTLLGKHLHDCLVRLKRTELSRFEQWRATAPPTTPGDVTDWEHREYFGAY